MGKPLKIKVDIIGHIRELFQEYEECFEDHDNGLVAYNDCLYDFLEWLEKKDCGWNYVGIDK